MIVMALVDQTTTLLVPRLQTDMAEAVAHVSAGPPLAELEAALAAPTVTLVSLNALLYRCDAEERDAT